MVTVLGFNKSYYIDWKNVHTSWSPKKSIRYEIDACKDTSALFIYFYFILYSGFVSMRQSHYLVTTLVYNVWCYGYSFLPYQSVSLIAYL